MKRASILIALAACGGRGGVTPDAGPNGDGAPDARPGLPGGTCANYVHMRCRDGMAMSAIDYYPGTTSMTLCSPSGTMYDYATCASGCAVVSEVQLQLGSPRVAAAALCAGAPAATAGTTCANDGDCRPTRATIAADGTVTGQDYLACAGTTCAASVAPTIGGYLQACDAVTLGRWGTPGVTGLSLDYAPCLIAWDSAANAPTSGITKVCMGDWDCPDGSLCDDQMTMLGGYQQYAVCKPGPKGTLTPAMLSR